MSWIKMKVSLATHPKVVIISSSLNDDRLKVVGALHAVWCVFDAHTEDGTLRGYTPEVLDSIIGWRGFSRAMIGVGWLLHIDDNTLCIKDYDEHNGKSAKRRAQNAVNKKRSRDDDKMTTVVTEMSSRHDDKMVTREDKIRIYTPIVPKGTDSDHEDPTSELPIGEGASDSKHSASYSLHRARMLFRMRPSTPLDESQQRAWKKNKGAVLATSEHQWLLLEWFYAQGTGKGEAGEFRRRDLATLLSHWNGEIQKAAGTAKNSGADFLQKKEGAAEPVGWRKIAEENFENSDPEVLATMRWETLPESVRHEILTKINEEGGAA